MYQPVVSRLANAPSKRLRKQTEEFQDNISSVRLERLGSITMVLYAWGDKMIIILERRGIRKRRGPMAYLFIP